MFLCFSSRPVAGAIAQFSVTSGLFTLGHHMASDHGPVRRGRAGLIAIDDAVLATAGVGRRLIARRLVIRRSVADYNEAAVASRRSNRFNAGRTSSQNHQHPSNGQFLHFSSIIHRCWHPASCRAYSTLILYSHHSIVEARQDGSCTAHASYFCSRKQVGSVNK